MTYKKIGAICVVFLVGAWLFWLKIGAVTTPVVPPSYSAQSSSISLVNAAEAPEQQVVKSIWFDSLRERLEGRIARQGDYICSVYVKPLGATAEPLVLHNEKLRAASMIKLFIMAEAFRQEKVGLLSLEEELVLTRNVKVGGAGNLQGSPDGTGIKLRELIDLMITESDNTATNMVVDRLTMDSINQFIVKMGFMDTVLQRKMMDFESVKNGRENYTSVHDIGVVLEKMYRGECVGAEADAAMVKILLRQTDNDKIPALLPDNLKIAHKTGELVGAFHDGGIVYAAKQAYIICIMTENVPHSTVQDIAKLSQIIYQSLNEE